MKVSIASECWTPSKEIWIEVAIIRYNLIVGGESLRAAFHKPVIRAADGKPPAAKLHNSIHFKIAGLMRRPAWNKAQGRKIPRTGRDPFPSAARPLFKWGVPARDLNRGSLAPVPIGSLSGPAPVRLARFRRGGAALTNRAPRSLSSIGARSWDVAGDPPSLAEVLLITHLVTYLSRPMKCLTRSGRSL